MWRRRRDKAAKPSLGSTTAIVVGNMIGTGLFTSLGFQAAEIDSPFTLLAIWVVGGIVALCGALSYAEIASALPRSGGEYSFLTTLYHPLVGFLSGWVSIVVGFAAPVALAAIAFGAYLNRIVPAVSPVLASLVLIAVTTVVFLFPLRVGSRYLGFFVLLNTSVLVVLMVAAFVWAEPVAIDFRPVLAVPDADLLGAFAVCLVYVMYSYSGWNAAAYIVEEVERPQRDVPRALLLGTLAVGILYLGVNAAFLYTTPLAEIEGQLEVGLVAARHIFGRNGGDVMALAICVGLVCSLAAMTWVGPRVAMVMGEDYSALAALARRSRQGVPWVAILFQSSFAGVLLLTASFEAVIAYVEFVLILSSFLTVLGVFVLRRRQDRPAQYRTWGYPVTPAVFLGMSLFIMVFLLRERPLESLYGLLTLGAGAILWEVFERRGGAQHP